MGLVHNATSHNYPLIMSLSVEENAVFIHKFSKNLPNVGGGKTPPTPSPHTLPPLGHFAPLLWPPLTHPGCTTVTGIAKMHKGPWSPLIGVKEIF